MKKIAVIGCGGINSWVAKHLFDVTKLFDKEELIYVRLFDNDEVEEKNLLRVNQNFEVEDLMKQKAEVLSKKYKFDFTNTFINESNLDLLSNFDDIILGVDNNKTRRLVYDYSITNKKYLLDLRAQGTQMAFIVVDGTRDMEHYDTKYFANKEIMERKGSCQLTHDVENDNIQNANKIIAFWGIYGLYLKRLRNETPALKEYKIVY